MRLKILKTRRFTTLIFNRLLHKPLLQWEQAAIKLSRDEVQNVETYWHENISRPVDASNCPKKYILSMFPYPSGNLHMGHVRVYTIADCIARYYALQGYDVFQPMGWDAFGLPAENAATERNKDPQKWTTENIETMRNQLRELGCSFNWKSELSTCDPSYYKWTQWIFVQLFKRGLAYKKKSFVNWDPVDRTVLAQEQIDSSGRSWRSGAQIEKRLLNQWYIKTTEYAKEMYDNLENLKEWRGVAAEQKNWLGDCRFYRFYLNIFDENSNKIEDDFVEIGLQNPSDLSLGRFLIVSQVDDMNLKFTRQRKVDRDYSCLNVKVKNPITQDMMPVVVLENPALHAELFHEYQTCKLAIPSKSQIDAQVKRAVFGEQGLPEIHSTEESSDFVLQKAKEEKWGGHISSHRLKDWCVSRQRYWGTPIPIVYCPDCGIVPVPELDLPVRLPERDSIDLSTDRNENELSTAASSPLARFLSWLQCTCPRCAKFGARRETDTLDTFFDSSFYYLRYLDNKNDRHLCDLETGRKWMPVDVYVGGKEHAVLHLYFARFICRFLNAIGASPVQEPFGRLMPQGVVMAPAYRLPSSGRYLPIDRVEKSPDGQTFVDKETGEEVEERREKMSKSKYNGVEPGNVLREFGCDLSRILMMGFVSPQAHRNWQVQGSVKGVHRWLNRLVYLVQNYVEQRKKTIDECCASFETDHPIEKSLRHQYNTTVQKVTFHNEVTFLLNTALNDLIVLTSALRRQPLDVYGKSLQFERCLHSLIIMCYPLMPHLAAELWAALKLVPAHSSLYNNESNIWSQTWPKNDPDARVKLIFWDEEEEFIDFTLVERQRLEQITLKQAVDLAKCSLEFKKFKSTHKIHRYTLNVLPNNIGLMLNVTSEKIPMTDAERQRLEEEYALEAEQQFGQERKKRKRKQNTN